MIAYIIGGSGFSGCVDYVTRRKLEEKLYKEQSKGQKPMSENMNPRSGSRVGLKRMSATAKQVTNGNNPVRGGEAIKIHRSATAARI